MKRKLQSGLVAALLILSALLMAGCDGDKKDAATDVTTTKLPAGVQQKVVGDRGITSDRDKCLAQGGKWDVVTVTCIK